MEDWYGATLCHNDIKLGSLWKLNKTWWLDGAGQPVDRGAVVMVIDLERIAGNVFYLLEDKVLRIDADSFMTQFRKISL